MNDSTKKKQSTRNQAKSTPAAQVKKLPDTSSASKAEPTKTAIPQVPVSSAPAPGVGASLFVRPASPSAQQASDWRASRPGDAAVMDRLAATPSAIWFGDWTPNPTAAVNDIVTRASAAGQLPVLVAYNIPNRDCGLYSAGGAANQQSYAAWIQAFANGIGKRAAIVILEPDAVANIDCMGVADQNTRLATISDAVTRLRSTTNASVYIDAGNATWHSASTIADRLNRANVAQATGFSLNVSNFLTTAKSNQYGSTVSQKTGGKHFVVDTSRNGNGGNGEWCNPAGRALGETPTTATGVANVDAYLWVKAPGESDGQCNGGPAAGVWWPEYALGLARGAGW